MNLIIRHIKEFETGKFRIKAFANKIPNGLLDTSNQKIKQKN